MSTIELPFRPRARLLQLLGDQLIGSPRLAVFELVKNAYDADASQVSVQFSLPDKGPAWISVEDNGEGMTLETIKDAWLVPGDDHRERQRAKGKRTPKYHRLPLGEKGLGRFAAHKLGNRILLVTRAAGEKEHVIRIDWNSLVAKKFLSESPVTIETRAPEVFKGQTTGTSIRIDDLRPPAWKRGDVRRLYRQIVSMSSPFEGPEDFKATLDVPQHQDWFEGLPDVREILKRAFWTFKFRLDSGVFEWAYEFKPRGVDIEGRKSKNAQDKLMLPASGDGDKKIVADASTSEGIGPVRGRFFIFDRDREVLSTMADSQQITQLLDEQGGVRVYRDGIRVYNYGEYTDDWLGLDLRRVNKPTRGISRNLVVGTVELSLEHSTGLIEKTNREGFVDNGALGKLKGIVLGALTTLEAERKLDKDRLRLALGSAPNPKTENIENSISELRAELKKERLLDKMEPLISRIEKNYTDLKETLIRPSATGLNLAVVFHEVERGVRAIHKAVASGEPMPDIERQTRDLMGLLDGFAVLLRKDERRVHPVEELISQSVRLNRLRFRHHRIELHPRTESAEGKGPKARFSMNLVLGALSNLIDNSIYWMRVRWPDGPKGTKGNRRLLIAPYDGLETGVALVVADSGTGFRDPPETLVTPFFTRKPDGMGLGLYYANMVMELNGGKLTFPNRGDVEVPEEYDGAILALEFKGEK